MRQCTIRPLLAAMALAAASGSAVAGENVVLVLDASGSMWGQIEGRAKIEIAREAVAGLVAGWQPENQLGLVAYGHRRKGDCNDIETLLEPGPLDADAYLTRINALNPTGMTPLSAAVIQASDILRSSEQKATVILVSDGEETCRADPCAVGRELAQAGVDFTAHVIGFDVSDPAHQAQLRCLAENTGGRYFNAGDAAELNAALGAVTAVTTQPALPPATARLQAPDEAIIGARVTVQWHGPGDEGDYVALIDGQREHSHVWVRQAQGEGTLATATSTGDYRLRYVSPRRASPILAERPIRLVEAQMAIEAPAQIMAASRVSVHAHGPVEPERNWVGFADIDAPAADHLDYAWSQDDSHYQLTAPPVPGEYEIRFVLGGGEPQVGVAQRVHVTEPVIVFDLPSAQAQAGSAFSIQVSGPDGEGNWISLAQVGSADGDYVDYRWIGAAQASYEFRLPETPGTFEFRFLLPGDRVAARAALAITP